MSMTLFWLIFWLVIIIMLIILIAIVNLIFEDTPDFSETHYLDPTSVKTGDILGVSYVGNFMCMVQNSMSRSKWVHPAIIWVDPESKKPYVMEGCNYFRQKIKHFFKIPLETWFYFNRKSVICYTKYDGPEIDPYVMDQVFKRFEDGRKLDSMSPSWLRFFLNIPYNYNIPRSEGWANYYSCLESAVIILQQSGICKKKKLPSSYYPKDIIFGRFETEVGTYKTPILVRMDSFIMKMERDIFENNLKNGNLLVEQKK